MNDDRKATAGVVGLGIAACAACCAGPIVAAVGTGALGPIGAGAAVLAGGVTLLWKRTRRSDDDTDVNVDEAAVLDQEPIQ